MGIVGARVLDPACGDGALLIAAAERLLRAQIDAGIDETVARHTIATEQLHGWDIDRTAIATASARLRTWADLAADVALPNLEHRDALLSPPPPVPFDVVVGNPPFLSARARATAPDTARRAALDARWPGLRLATTDAAALFVALTLDLLAPGGCAALILPQSFLSADGAGPVRAHAAKAATWIGATVIPGTPFEDAAVEVVVLSWRRGGRPGSLRLTGTQGTTLHEAVRPSGRATWAPPVAKASGWPCPTLRTSSGRLGDLARATADFRDQFYGLVPHVVDLAAEANPDAAWLPLAVSGAIDPAVHRWGERPIRYAGRILRRPAVDAFALRADPKLGSWATSRLVPKVVVATQGRVLEAFADPSGQVVPAVPTLSVTPHQADALFHVCAVVLAPASSAWLGAQVWGAGLSSSAIKASAKQLATLPLPTDAEAWGQAADELRHAHDAPHEDVRARHLRAFATAMDDAYGLTGDAACAAWWCARALKEG